MSETIQPADDEIETRVFGGPAFGVNLLERAALLRSTALVGLKLPGSFCLYRYGMVISSPFVLSEGLPVLFQAWTR